jgi:hypothetical protein
MEVAEDPIAGPDDVGRFAFDEGPEGVAIAGQDGPDCRAFRQLVDGKGLGGELDGSLDRSISRWLTPGPTVRKPGRP